MMFEPITVAMTLWTARKLTTVLGIAPLLRPKAGVTRYRQLYQFVQDTFILALIFCRNGKDYGFSILSLGNAM